MKIVEVMDEAKADELNAVLERFGEVLDGVEAGDALTVLVRLLAALMMQYQPDRGQRELYLQQVIALIHHVWDMQERPT